MTIDILNLSVQDLVSLSPLSVVLLSVWAPFLDRFQQLKSYMLTVSSKSGRMKECLFPEKTTFFTTENM